MAGRFGFLSDEERARLAFMRAIVTEVFDTPMTLKGGTALLLAHGLDRFSEDLDFDSTVAINLEARLQRAAGNTDARITDIRLRKNTQTTRRYRVDFETPHGPDTLKIEISLRPQAIDPKQVLETGRMRVYAVEALIEQKLEAMAKRTRVRDLYDVHYLVTTYGERFSRAQLETLHTLVNDPDHLHGRYVQGFQGDPLLARTTLDELVMGVSLMAENTLKSRNESPAVTDTDPPVNPSVARRLTADALLRANGMRVINDQLDRTDFDERRQTLHAPPVDQPDREAYARALIDSYARWRANQEVELSESEKALYSQALLAAVGAQTGLFKTRAATPHTGQQRGAGEATAAAMTQRAHRDVAAMIGRLQRSLAEDRYKDRDHDASNDRSRER